jgi:sugar phosphate isomerase/epimerase
MNNFGMPHAELRATLDRLGLRAPSTHVGPGIFDAMDRALDEAQALGHEYLIVAGFPEAQRRTLDDWRRWADRMNEAGAVARRRNVWVGFHTHAGDLAPIDGQVGYYVFMDRTDPAVTRHQLDIGNTAMANVDPLQVLERYNDRFWSFHVKDVPQMGARHDAELGKGVLDLRRILSSARHADGRLLFVEQETYPGDPLESVRRDFAYMRSIGY